jgi:cell division protein FtsQ
MQFTSRVLVANGNIFERYKNHDSVYSYIGHQLYKIASYVDKHEFWKAQIEQIFVTRDNEFILIPKIGNHIILLEIQKRWMRSLKNCSFSTKKA